MLQPISYREQYGVGSPNSKLHHHNQELVNHRTELPLSLGIIYLSGYSINQNVLEMHKELYEVRIALVYIISPFHSNVNWLVYNA